jgi:cytochrome P450
MIGGHGTTTDTLCFIYILLSIHPEAMHRLREEHDRIFDPDVNITVAILRQTPQKTSELEYTTAVIKETLRLFPVGFSIRKADQKTYDSPISSFFKHILSLNFDKTDVISANQ